MRTTSIDTVTDAVIASVAPGADERLQHIYASLIRHLHAFAREVELTPEEWLAGIEFLTATGQACDAIRQEFILLSDTCGLSMLVDAMANRKSGGATESTVIGPFHTDDAPEVALDASIATAGKGEPLIVRGRVSDPAGRPIPGALVEAWETDGDGLYDTQYAQRAAPDCRGFVRTADDGSYAFRAVVPVDYSIPTDGPVGLMLRRLGRKSMRPAHLHFKISADGLVPVVTSIFVDTSPYLDDDAVFGVKSSLIEPFVRHESAAEAAALGIAAPFFTLERDFVLVPSHVGAAV
jgi:protocatechuate 3,4-dioxygenase beta subunit